MNPRRKNISHTHIHTQTYCENISHTHTQPYTKHTVLHTHTYCTHLKHNHLAQQNILIKHHYNFSSRSLEAKAYHFQFLHKSQKAVRLLRLQQHRNLNETSKDGIHPNTFWSAIFQLPIIVSKTQITLEWHTSASINIKIIIFTLLQFARRING